MRPDPRFGMQAPIVKSLVITKPGGITSTRSATLSDPANLLTLTSQTDTVTLDGKTTTRTYAAATKNVTTTTPVGRQSFVTLDALGRIVAIQQDATFGLLPMAYSYDNNGRLSQAMQGAQSWTYAYGPASRRSTRTDAAGGAVTYGYDAADRVTQMTLPGGHGYGSGYDADGNRTQVTMPNLGTHAFTFDKVSQDASYAPPSNSPYVTGHDADGRVNVVTLPGGRTETFAYDVGGRPLGVSYPEAAVAFSYAMGDPTARIGNLTRTPSAGAAQQIQLAYGGDLVSGANWTGAAVGQFTYTYDNAFKLKSISLASGLDNVATALARDNDGLLTALGPFTIARAGPAGAPSQLGDGTLVVAQATTRSPGSRAAAAPSAASRDTRCSSPTAIPDAS